MHVSSLPGGYSVGSFGDGARQFIDFLVKAGFSYWQVLPFCAPDEFGSPYKSYSAFGANPWFIDLPTLYEKGLLTARELSDAREESPYLAEYDRLSRERVDLLKRAAMRVDDRSAVLDFIKRYPELDLAAEFMALKSENLDTPWQLWQKTDADRDTLFIWQFIQYEFYNQWMEIKKYSNDRGIQIIGDIPIYVSLDSADVWAHREQFSLNSEGYPTRVAGVPPDYFSEDGQLWGNPLYDFKQMKKDGYSWWKSRMEYMSELFDGVRIDHFRAFESYFAIPADATSAKAGKWVKGPGKKFVEMLKDAARGGLIIAEDLGDITPQVRALVDGCGLAGMRVVQFGFLGDRLSPHLPHNYSHHSVAYTGTHDNNTALGYVWELDPETRRTVFDYCGYDGENLDTGTEYLIKTVLASHSDLAILPIQDLLGFGSDTRMNTPGRAKGNWQYRLSFGQLESIDADHWYRLNHLYCRI